MTGVIIALQPASLPWGWHAPLSQIRGKKEKKKKKPRMLIFKSLHFHKAPEVLFMFLRYTGDVLSPNLTAQGQG